MYMYIHTSRESTKRTSTCRASVYREGSKYAYLKLHLYLFIYIIYTYMCTFIHTCTHTCTVHHVPCTLPQVKYNSLTKR